MNKFYINQINERCRSNSTPSVFGAIKPASPSSFLKWPKLWLLWWEHDWLLDKVQESAQINLRSYPSKQAIERWGIKLQDIKSADGGEYGWCEKGIDLQGLWGGAEWEEWVEGEIP